MKLLDLLLKPLGYVQVPTKTRRYARSANRAFQAGITDSFNIDWRTDSAHINEDLRRHLRKMRERSRDLFKNGPYTARYEKLIRTNVVGSNGVALQVKPLDNNGQVDASASKVIEASFKRWAKRGNCDVTRSLSWRQVQDQVALAIPRDGEALLRLVSNYGNDHQFAVQTIDVELLDIELNREALDGKNRIVMGIEVDEWSAPVRYHFRDSSMQTGRTRSWSHPASEIIHLFNPFFADQKRGYPETAAIMQSLRTQEAYEDAEVTAARAAASKMGIITGAAGDEMTPDEETGGEEMEMAPASFQRLKSGETLTPLDFSHPNTAFPEFIKSLLHRVAASLGLSFASLSGNLSEVNYSSIRWGGLEEREYWKLCQALVIEGLCDRVYSAWLEVQLLANLLLDLPIGKYRKFNAASWQGRRWAWVDPLNEMKAIELGLAMRIITPSQVAQEQGMDLEDVLQQFADDIAMAAEKKVPVPWANIQQNNNGGAQHVEAQPA